MEREEDDVRLEELTPAELAELLLGENEEIDEEQAHLLREFIAHAGGAVEALEVLEAMLKKAA